MNLTHILALFMAFVGANAWGFTVMDKKNFCGQRRTFYSVQGDNNCYEIPDDVAGDVHSLVWCTMPHTRCSITLHSEHRCLGNLLASSDSGFWERKDIKDRKTKTKSFRVQGCKKIGTNLDEQFCYGSGIFNKAPWEKNDC